MIPALRDQLIVSFVDVEQETGEKDRFVFSVFTAPEPVRLSGSPPTVRSGLWFSSQQYTATISPLSQIFLFQNNPALRRMPFRSPRSPSVFQTTSCQV